MAELRDKRQSGSLTGAASKHIVKSIFDRSWLWRRYALFSQLVIVDGILIYIVIANTDSVLHRDISSSIMIFLGVVINGYLSIAVWDDKNRDQAHKDIPGGVSIEETTTKSTVTSQPVPDVEDMPAAEPTTVERSSP